MINKYYNKDQNINIKRAKITIFINIGLKLSTSSIDPSRWHCRYVAVLSSLCRCCPI